MATIRNITYSPTNPTQKQCGDIVQPADFNDISAGYANWFENGLYSAGMRGYINNGETHPAFGWNSVASTNLVENHTRKNIARLQDSFTNYEITGTIKLFNGTFNSTEYWTMIRFSIELDGTRIPLNEFYSENTPAGQQTAPANTEHTFSVYGSLNQLAWAAPGKVEQGFLVTELRWVDSNNVSQPDLIPNVAHQFSDWHGVKECEMRVWRSP